MLVFNQILDCDPACERGCTNSGRLSCKGCAKGWKEIGSGKEGCEGTEKHSSI